MEYIFTSIFAAIFGALFLYWGIYQIKTGKMVAKNTKNPIDEPREVGVIFAIIGMLGLSLAVILFTNNPVLVLPHFFQKLAAGFMTSATAATFVTMFACSLVGLKKHRIFSVKSTKSIDKIVKKFYIPANLGLAAFSVLLPAAFFGNTYLELGIFAGSLALLGFFCFLIFIICMISVSILAKKQK